MTFPRCNVDVPDVFIPLLSVLVFFFFFFQCLVHSRAYNYIFCEENKSTQLFFWHEIVTHEVEPWSSGKLHTVCGLCGNVCAEQNIYCITIKPALVLSAHCALPHTCNIHGSLLFLSLVVTVTYAGTPSPACQRSRQRAEERSTLQS